MLSPVLSLQVGGPMLGAKSIALFTITKKQKQANCPSTEGQRNPMGVHPRGEQASAMKRTKGVTPADP